MKAARTILLPVLFLLVSEPASVWGGTLAQFRTVLGDIEVELYDQDKPITVQNFIRYAQRGLYGNSILHRCPVNPFTRTSDFVVQGGGIYVADRGTTNAALDFIPSLGEIPNEFGVGRRFSNVYGTLAMAKLGGNTNSASSQWFFNLKDNSFLDAPDTNNLFVVFGRVVRGTNVLNQFIGRSYNDGIVNLGGVLSELPVTYSGARVPTYDELVYVDISLLHLQARTLAGGAREISWNSVSNSLNHLEVTAGWPPNWQLLVSTNGTGARLSVIDTNVAEAARFYRIKITGIP